MSNEEQVTYWNGDAGEKWTENADQLDDLLQPILPEIISRAALRADEYVLDIGCGAGALTLEASRLVGAKLGAVGVDISEPLVALARKRAAAAARPAVFTVEDACTYVADPKFDAAISRFGVMFFSDPTAAFAAVRQNMRPGGRLVFACWQSLKQNQWASVAMRAALQFLPEPPPTPDPHAPGPFAFADADRVSNLLRTAGWGSVSVEPWTGDLRLPGDTTSDNADFLMKVGPMARMVADQGVDPEPIRQAVVDRLTEIRGDRPETLLPAAVWLVSTTAP